MIAYQWHVSKKGKIGNFKRVGEVLVKWRKGDVGRSKVEDSWEEFRLDKACHCLGQQAATIRVKL